MRQSTCNSQKRNSSEQSLPCQRQLYKNQVTARPGVPARETGASRSAAALAQPTALKKKATLKTQDKSIQSRERHSGRQSTNTFLEHENKN
ncbi:hypothetical protein MG293_009089 [Ovis ammon polii]|uniref:Uncharacterized protein n=1 Tax=Ovis ammon polii TaxID=230172 RepID=A0AAD4U429_OVIAM|nr:hypothetical protein MG293_009089 [Ovis ammon polii]KAI4567724.1 hypothetical protein MJT46_007522 [Ovis ammon polii x Ovis aries]